MDPDLLTDEERKERESTWIVTCPHCGVGHGVRVDDSDLQATIATQAATIERFREWRRTRIALDDRGFTDTPDNFQALLSACLEADAAITAADMGEDG